MPLGMMTKILLFLPGPAALLPKTDTHAPRHTHKLWNHILEAPVCLQVYFGVGGDCRLRLHPHSPPSKHVSSYKHSQPFGWEKGGNISPPVPEVS